MLLLGLATKLSPEFWAIARLCGIRPLLIRNYPVCPEPGYAAIRAEIAQVMQLPRARMAVLKRHSRALVLRVIETAGWMQPCGGKSDCRADNSLR